MFYENNRFLENVFKKEESVTNVVTVTGLVTMKRDTGKWKPLFLRLEQYCGRQDKDCRKKHEEKPIVIGADASKRTLCGILQRLGSKNAN